MVWQGRATPKVLTFALLGLTVFLSWQALSLRGYARADARPPAWDQAIHLEIAHDYRAALAEGRLGDLIQLAPKPGMPPFPPLYHLLVAAFYDDANPTGAAIWVNWFYLALLCVALFGICWHFRPDETALAAVVAFVCTPAIMDLLTTQLIDLAVVAWSAAAFWLLLKTDEFKSWPYSIAFGVAFAAGMLHKWSFFSYMIPAYWLGLKALGEPKSRLQALASLGAALLLFAPWYIVHLPVLIPRLFQATADFAVPVWKGGAFFLYLLHSAHTFGPLFWGLGWLALLVAQPRRRIEQFWMVLAWVLGSYLFWAIVPNRQMRFLLPGLPGLAVCAAMAWPSVLLWLLAGFQAFTALNYTAGWIKPIPVSLPLVSFTIFQSDPPRVEDWKIAAILKEAEKRADPQKPLANLTLIANASRFNGPTFTWMRKQLGLRKVNVRGVNRRLCEFAQFVVLKEGELGPAGVISGLAEAAQIVRDQDGWFRKSYADVGRFPLPDGSAAVLFAQRAFTAPPMKEGKVRFDFYENGHVHAANMKIELGVFDKAAGVYPRAALAADSVVVRGLTVSKPAVEFHGLSLVSAAPPLAPEWDDVRLLKLERLVIKSAQVTAPSLRAWLEMRVKNLKISRLELAGGLIRVDAVFASIAVSAVARPQLRPDGLLIRLEELRLGVTPLPAALLGRRREFLVPFTPTPETPFAISIGSLSLENNHLTIK